MSPIRVTARWPLTYNETVHDEEQGELPSNTRSREQYAVGSATRRPKDGAITDSRAAIGIVDNDELTLMVLSQYCRQSLHRPVWCATLGKKALDVCLDTHHEPPAVLLIDMSLNDMPGVELLSTLRTWKCGVPALAITSFPLERYARSAANAGAQGIVAKRSLATMSSAITAVMNGGTWNRDVPDVEFHPCEEWQTGRSDIPTGIPGIRSSSGTDDEARCTCALSGQENRMMALISRGFTTPMIAQELNISVNTVKTHIARAMRKLGATRRGEAVAIWLEGESGRVSSEEMSPDHPVA